MPSQKLDISENILQNVLPKHNRVTSLTDNNQTNIKVIINTNIEEFAVEKHSKYTLFTETGKSNQNQNMYQMPSQKPNISSKSYKMSIGIDHNFDTCLNIIC